jgi:hypothetical protein
MKKILLLCLGTMFFSSYRSPEFGEASEPAPVLVTGRLLNHDRTITSIEMTVYRLCPASETLVIPVDSLGNFRAGFEVWHPSEIEIRSYYSFWMLVHPGDSIHLTFDAHSQNRPEFLKSLTFSGDAAGVNRDATAFDYLLYTDSLPNHLSRDDVFFRDYDPEEYIRYSQSLRSRSLELLDRFTAERNPDEKIRIWVETSIECDYYRAVSLYHSMNRIYNNLAEGISDPGEDRIPTMYLDSLSNYLPIDPQRLIVTASISDFIINYWTLFLNSLKFAPDGTSLWSGITDRDFLLETAVRAFERMNDPIARQLLLSMIFYGMFDYESDAVEVFERYRESIDRYVTLPCLYKPLQERYRLAKNRKEFSEGQGSS